MKNKIWKLGTLLLLWFNRKFLEDNRETLSLVKNCYVCTTRKILSMKEKHNNLEYEKIFLQNRSLIKDCIKNIQRTIKSQQREYRQFNLKMGGISLKLK